MLCNFKIFKNKLINKKLLMPNYFAEIDSSNVVLRVIVCDTKEWCENSLGGTWVQTYRDDSSKNPAGRGMIYHADKENFSSTQPYPSWVLDNNCDWQPPTPMPDLTQEEIDANKYYNWEESSGSWIIETIEVPP
tara:strand:+ start:860 stop:1261 length:402 start_codon:yes stop_codon:yes gene_type:complete